jgi:serine O-acetyltransferase
MGNIFYRIGNFLYKFKIPFAWIFFKFLIRLICNSAIDPRTTIGKGTKFGYGGISIVIHTDAVIGKNVMVSPNVVIGGRSNQKPPVILDNVFIGSGASILGDITIGNNSTIGAGAVVLNDVGDNETWAGVPAKKIK